MSDFDTPQRFTVTEEQDISEILNEGQEWWDGYFPSEMEARFRQLHAETQTALQIALATGTFAVGTYEAPRYTARWQRVEL